MLIGLVSRQKGIDPAIRIVGQFASAAAALDAIARIESS